jgi:hypothetical protein
LSLCQCGLCSHQYYYWRTSDWPSLVLTVAYVISFSLFWGKNDAPSPVLLCERQASGLTWKAGSESHRRYIEFCVQFRCGQGVLGGHWAVGTRRIAWCFIRRLDGAWLCAVMEARRPHSMFTNRRRSGYPAANLGWAAWSVPGQPCSCRQMSRLAVSKIRWSVECHVSSQRATCNGQRSDPKSSREVAHLKNLRCRQM